MLAQKLLKPSKFLIDPTEFNCTKAASSRARKIGSKALAENTLIESFDKAKAQGELSKDFDSKRNAMLIGLLINGSAVMARSGKPIEDLRAAFGLSLAGLDL